MAKYSFLNTPEDAASNALLEQMLPKDKDTFRRGELAEILSVPVHTLAMMAMQRRGPSFIKVGSAVRYPRAAVLDWLKQNSVKTKND